MNKPTTTERLSIYQDALKRIRSGRDEFMCNAICKSYDKFFKLGLKDGFWDADILSMFPEFIAQKPKNLYSEEVWYNRKELGSLIVQALRIEVLKKCIVRLEKKIRNEKHRQKKQRK